MIVNREEHRLPKMVELVIPILTSRNTAGFYWSSQRPYLRASPRHTGNRLLHFRIEYCLVSPVPTHKCHKSPFKHSKTIYVFTSGWVIVTVQIHSRKMQNGPSIPESNRICPILLQDLMERGVCQCGVEMLLVPKENFKFSLGISKRLHWQKFPCYNFSDLKVKVLGKSKVCFCKETMSQGQ